MSDPCTKPVPEPCKPATSDKRVLQCFSRRYNAAFHQASIPLPPHTTNDDEAKYADKCGSYSKGLLQQSPGVVDPVVFKEFRKAIDRASFADFEKLKLGGTKTLNGPMGSYAYPFCGADNSEFGDAASVDDPGAKLPVVPPAPGLASVEYATELVELYWCSLLRDTAFTEYAGDSTAIAAAAELSGMPEYAGPRAANGEVTPDLLFRGTYPGEEEGPYVSQFFLAPTNLGAQPIDQRYITYQAGLDYMTSLADWEKVQSGIDTKMANVNDPIPRYLHDGRGFAAYTHVDELFQAYFTAYLVLRSMKTPVNPGNPYASSKTQNGFGTFGPPDFATVLAEVAKTALNSVWYQKWVVHLRHRPEAGGGLVHLIEHGKAFDGAPDEAVFGSKALAASHTRYGSYLLSQAFPEGSPTHPAYPTGHGAVGGACITILKFFFDGTFVIPNPKVPSSDGLSLAPWTCGSGSLTVNGELHKLAHNITFGHGLHGGIHWRSDSDISMRLGEAVAIRYLKDLACTYAEPFHVSFTRLDGSIQTITNVAHP